MVLQFVDTGYKKIYGGGFCASYGHCQWLDIKMYCVHGTPVLGECLGEQLVAAWGSSVHQSFKALARPKIEKDVLTRRTCRFAYSPSSSGFGGFHFPQQKLQQQQQQQQQQQPVITPQKTNRACNRGMNRISNQREIGYIGNMVSLFYSVNNNKSSQ